MMRGKQIMKVNDTTVFLTERAIVSDNLKKEIRSFVEEDIEVALNIGSMLDMEVRDNVVNDVMNLLSQLYQNDIIDQYDVVCDGRNNDKHEYSKGVTHMSVKFRQWNSLKATILEYRMVREPKIKSRRGKNGVKQSKRVVI